VALTSYERAREAWLKEILSDQLQALPAGLLQDLSRSMARVDQEIAAAEGREPRRSLLVGERNQLRSFYEQIVGTRCTKLVTAACEGDPPPAHGEADRDLFEAAANLADSYKERFYKILREAKPSAEPSRAPAEPVPSVSPEHPQVEGPPEDEEQRAEPRPGSAENLNRILRILSEFPCFVGRDLNSYGPFAKEDIVAVPDETAEILVERGIGKEIIPAGEDR
jgi:DNA replication initiation complex subunit (GINS family)